MARFAYIADTHWGADPMAYQMQKGYPDLLPELLDLLAAHGSASGGIDFLIHGGDLIDAADDDTIRAAADVLDLPFPVHLCLGNHDLTMEDAAERWLELAPNLFRDDLPSYTIDAGDCRIHVLPTHWCDRPFFWDGSQRPHFALDQVEMLKRGLAESPDVPHLIVTHSPVYGLPTEQTGFDRPHHGPGDEFTEEVMRLIAGHNGVVCVLSAHNHMNMRVDVKKVDFVTVSSFVETPFECKVFDVTSRRIEMQTVALGPILDSKEAYDESRSFVQGRSVDRTISRAL